MHTRKSTRFLLNAEAHNKKKGIGNNEEVKCNRMPTMNNKGVGSSVGNEMSVKQKRRKDAGERGNTVRRRI